MFPSQRARRWKWMTLLAALVGLGLVGALGDGTAAVSGVILGADGVPLAGATVRILATTHETVSSEDGSFTLRGLIEGQPVTVSAWLHDYYSARIVGVLPPEDDLELHLHKYQVDDNPDYEWALPTSCSECKGHIVEPWLENAHALAGTNPRFFSMYNGTDTSGTHEVAPGYVQDFPGTAGVCANCHAPGAAIDAPFTTDMNALDGADVFGVHCDLCHKTAAVYLNPTTKLPYENAPGVQSMDVRRSFFNEEGELVLLFFGPFDDPNVDDGDTYLPLIQESAFCAPCHQFSFWGTPIYESYREWLESPYSDPEEGATCQACHMPAPQIIDGEPMTNVAPGVGGVERDPQTLRSHAQRGALDIEFLQDTVELILEAEATDEGSITAKVSLKNAKAGHHVPTDYPGRQMILIVTATDSAGETLVLVDGPTLPDWCGDEANLPGVAYAKVLRDVETGESPVVNYWKQTLIESDNRLAAFEVDETTYRFKSGAGASTIRATVLFRRLFQDLAEAKGWGMPDILMEEAQLLVEPGAGQ